MLETERLSLRKLTPDDAAALYRVYHQPDVFRYFTKGPPDSVAVARADIERHLKHYEQHGFGLWATILRDSDELIGRCGLLSQQIDNVAEVEIGYRCRHGSGGAAWPPRQPAQFVILVLTCSAARTSSPSFIRRIWHRSGLQRPSG